MLLLVDLRDDRWYQQRVESSAKEIRRIFQRVGEINDENQKKNRAQNTALRNSSLDRKKG